MRSGHSDPGSPVTLNIPEMASSSKTVQFGDPDFEKTLEFWSQEIESDFSDAENDLVESEHNTDSESEIFESDSSTEVQENENEESENKDLGRWFLLLQKTNVFIFFLSF